jgi:hypothetical protein
MVEFSLIHKELVEECFRQNSVYRAFGAWASGRKTKNATKMYPIVIGGMNLRRCAVLDAKASELLHDTHPHDIDIKWVIVPALDDHNIKTNALFRNAHEARMTFLENVANDARLLAVCRNLERKTDTRIQLLIREKPVRDVWMLRNSIYSIVAEYTDNKTSLTQTMTLIDTTISSTYSNPWQASYKPDLQQPIPVQWNNGIPYATCHYLAFETMNMVRIYYQEYIESLKQKHKDVDFGIWVRHKLLKYLSKMIIVLLIVTRHNVIKSDADWVKIRQLHKQTTKSILVKSQALDKQDVLIKRLLAMLRDLYKNK